MGKLTKLTKPHEVFINELIKGNTQRQAYLKAYPSYKNWSGNALDCNASKLFKKPQVQQRYKEVLEKCREKEQEKTMWTRENSIETLRYVVDVNKADLERIQAACDEEIDVLLKQIQKNPQDAIKLTKALLQLRKGRRASQTNNKGITDAVSELNKMQGFNEETINLNESVIFAGEDKLED